MHQMNLYFVTFQKDVKFDVSVFCDSDTLQMHHSVILILILLCGWMFYDT